MTYLHRVTLRILPVAVAWLALFPTIARADQQARLAYVRTTDAEGCPGEDALVAAVKAKLGYSPFFPIASLLVSVEMRREGERYHAIVRLVDRGKVAGTRALNATSCDELVRTVALSLSLAIDPEAAARLEAFVPPEPPAPPAADPAPPPKPMLGARTAEPTHPRKIEGQVFLSAAVHLGSAPAPNLGALGGVRGRIDDISLGLGLRVDAEASRETGQFVRPSASLVAFDASPCVHIGPLATCAVVLVGAYRASSEGSLRPFVASELHVAVGPRLRVEASLVPHVRFFGEVEFVAALTEHDLLVDERIVFRQPRGAFGLSLGVALSSR